MVQWARFSLCTVWWALAAHRARARGGGAIAGSNPAPSCEFIGVDFRKRWFHWGGFSQTLISLRRIFANCGSTEVDFRKRCFHWGGFSQIVISLRWVFRKRWFLLGRFSQPEISFHWGRFSQIVISLWWIFANCYFTEVDFRKLLFHRGGFSQIVISLRWIFANCDFIEVDFRKLWFHWGGFSKHLISRRRVFGNWKVSENISPVISENFGKFRKFRRRVLKISENFENLAGDFRKFRKISKTSPARTFFDKFLDFPRRNISRNFGKFEFFKGKMTLEKKNFRADARVLHEKASGGELGRKLGPGEKSRVFFPTFQKGDCRGNPGGRGKGTRRLRRLVGGWGRKVKIRLFPKNTVFSLENFSIPSLLSWPRFETHFFPNKKIGKCVDSSF